MAMEEFNVFAMADEYAKAANVQPEHLFTPPEPAAATAPVEEPKAPEEPTEIVGKPKKSAPWTPDASLLAGMSEMTRGPKTYAKDEIIPDTEDHTLKNIADEEAIQESRESMDALARAQANIEEVKAARGYIKLGIPKGEFEARIIAAAQDNNHARAIQHINEIFDEIEKTYPHFITERVPGTGPAPINPPDFRQDAPPIDPIPETSESLPDPPQEYAAPLDDPTAPVVNPGEVGIVIDKSQVGELAWTPEEMEKIRRARSIQLHIRDAKPIDFGEVRHAPRSAVDKIVQKYRRKMNDVEASLPASHYRCTFRGLSYPEVLDLASSAYMNNMDGEYHKWSICFDHMENQSIGPWREYKEYPDPTTGNMIQIGPDDDVPEGIADEDVHFISKFEDFMRKTSFADLDFMIWKILCATAMDKEIISLKCKTKVNGIECGHTYDWVYSPADLLLPSSIAEAVLKEMEKTANAASTEEILAHYQESPVAKNSTVTLSSSGWALIFGHVNAARYLSSAYPIMVELEEEQKESNDPSIQTRAMAAGMLTVIKGIMVPDEDGNGWLCIDDPYQMIDMLISLNEVDWQTASTLVEMMMSPYVYKFVFRDIVCPKCKTKSNLKAKSLYELLFLVAQTLSNARVELRTN